MDAELFSVCIHEHAHAAVGRCVAGVAGWVVVERVRPGTLSMNGARYNGAFWHDPIPQPRARRLVGWAGLVAERFAADPTVQAEAILRAVESEERLLSDSDLRQIGKARLADVTECLKIVRYLWPTIWANAARECEAAERQAPAPQRP